MTELALLLPPFRRAKRPRNPSPQTPTPLRVRTGKDRGLPPKVPNVIAPKVPDVIVISDDDDDDEVAMKQIPRQPRRPVAKKRRLDVIDISDSEDETKLLTFTVYIKARDLSPRHSFNLTIIQEKDLPTNITVEVQGANEPKMSRFKVALGEHGVETTTIFERYFPAFDTWRAWGWDEPIRLPTEHTVVVLKEPDTVTGTSDTV